jgi:hypothetical protein
VGQDITEAAQVTMEEVEDSEAVQVITEADTEVRKVFVVLTLFSNFHNSLRTRMEKTPWIWRRLWRRTRIWRRFRWSRVKLQTNRKMTESSYD